MGVASLVLGILAIVITLFSSGLFGFLGAILGLVGLILGVVARKKAEPDKRGLATAGFVCSIIGLVLGILLYIACVACLSAGAAGLETYNNY